MNYEKKCSLVHQYTSSLYRLSLSLGFSANDSEEIVQNTWTTFFGNINNFEGRSTLKTYLFGILYLKAKEFSRQSFKFFKMESIDHYMEQSFDNTLHWSQTPMSPHDFSEKIEVLNIIESCLEDIPLNYKMAFILKEIEEESTQAICHLLGLTTNNLGVLLFRAKNKLKLCIEAKIQ